MKKFIVILCALLIGAVVSAASAEAPLVDKVNFYVVKCAEQNKTKILSKAPDAIAAVLDWEKKIVDVAGGEKVLIAHEIPQDNLFAVVQNIYRILKSKNSPCTLGLRCSFRDTRGCRASSYFLNAIDLYRVPKNYTLEAAAIVFLQDLGGLQRDILSGLSSFSDKQRVVTCSNTKCHKAGRSTCSRCKIAKYCSKECQKADWETHKTHCKPCSQFVTSASDTAPGA